MSEFTSDRYLLELTTEDAQKLSDMELIGLFYQVDTVSMDCFDRRTSRKWSIRIWNLSDAETILADQVLRRNLTVPERVRHIVRSANSKYGVTTEDLYRKARQNGWKGPTEEELKAATI